MGKTTGTRPPASGGHDLPEGGPESATYPGPVDDGHQVRNHEGVRGWRIRVREGKEV